jgi:hypothetical protein
MLRPGIDGELTVRDARGRERDWRRQANGDVEVRLGRGEEAFVYRNGDRPDFELGPVGSAGPAELWGLPV